MFDLNAWNLPVEGNRHAAGSQDAWLGSLRTVMAAVAFIGGTSMSTPYEVVFDPCVSAVSWWPRSSDELAVQVAVRVVSDGDTLNRVKESSGLTWEQLAQVFGVSRRTVHLWTRGGKLNALHAEALRSLAHEVESLAGRTPLQVRAMLMTSDSAGRTPLDRVRALRSSPEDRISAGIPFRNLLPQEE